MTKLPNNKQLWFYNLIKDLMQILRKNHWICLKNLKNLLLIVLLLVKLKNLFKESIPIKNKNLLLLLIIKMRLYQRKPSKNKKVLSELFLKMRIPKNQIFRLRKKWLQFLQLEVRSLNLFLIEFLIANLILNSIFIISISIKQF